MLERGGSSRARSVRCSGRAAAGGHVERAVMKRAQGAKKTGSTGRVGVTGVREQEHGSAQALRQGGFDGMESDVRIGDAEVRCVLGRPRCAGSEVVRGRNVGEKLRTSDDAGGNVTSARSSAVRESDEAGDESKFKTFEILRGAWS
jgi:hypothetical protein